jgi:antimicrobial peptide system SdpA family protein
MKLVNKPLYYYITWLFWISIIYYFLIGFNPSVIQDHKVKKNLMFIFPQGWGFFTRSPREAIVEAYQEKDGVYKQLTMLNASIDNDFGLSRDSRIVGMELSEVLNFLKSKSWKNKTGIRKVPKESIPDTIKLTRKLDFFTPGNYVFYQYKIVPFSWANQGQEKNAPYIVAKIHISDELMPKDNRNELFQKNSEDDN